MRSLNALSLMLGMLIFTASFYSAKVHADSVIVPSDGYVDDGDPFFGKVSIGRSRKMTSGLGFCVRCILNPGCNDPAIFGAAYITGSSDFHIVEDHCAGRAIFPGGCCTIRVEFSPTSLGEKTGTEVIPWHSSAHVGPSFRPLSGTGIRKVHIPIITDFFRGNLDFTEDGKTIRGELAINSFDGHPVSSKVPFCLSCGEPVNLATGAMWHQLTDFSIAGRTQETSLTLTRTYLAQPVLKDGDFGPHWIHPWETRVLPFTTDEDSDLVWVDEVGGAWVFERNEDHSLKSPAGFFGTLTEFADRYELRKPHGIVLTFSKDASHYETYGKLLSIKEPHGESVQLAYDVNGYLTMVSTEFAGAISFARNEAGRVVSVTRKRDGLTYTYNYNSDGLLSNSSDFEQRTWTYSYSKSSTVPERDGLLLQLVDPLNRAITFNYDGRGRALSQTVPGNATRSFAYSTVDGLPRTQVTELDGRVWQYQFDASYCHTQTIAPDGSVELTEWNDQNQISKKTDALGFETHFEYDTHGNMTSVQKPEDAQPTKIFYDAKFDLPTMITPLAGAPTQFKVDPVTGDIVQVSRTAQDNMALSLDYTYDKFGNRLSTRNGRGTYADETDSNGLRTRVFDIRNPETRSYDSRGRLIKSAFKSGRTLSYSYDQQDRIVQVQDSHGPSVSIAYDIMGRILSRTLSDGRTSQTTRYEWDARDRLISQADALGNKTQYLYDEAGPGSSVLVTDLPMAVINALGEKTQFQYDAFHRKISETDAKGGVTSFQYNARGDLIALTDPSGQKTTFAYDGNGRMTSRSRPSLLTDAKGKTVATTEVTAFFYDAARRLTEEHKISSSGSGLIGITEYKYDAFDRVTQKIEKTLDSHNVITVQDDAKYTYQSQLDVTRLASANNSVEKLSFKYEALPPFANTGYGVHAADPNNPLDLIQGDYIIDRDATGEIANIRDQVQHKLFNAVYDPAGRLVFMASGDLFRQSNATASLTAQLSYDSFGRKTRVDYSTGLSGRWSYDPMNRPTEIRWDQKQPGILNTLLGKVSPLTSEAIVYDSIGNITESARPFGKLSYGYDPIHQLTDVSIRDQIQSPFGFDIKKSFTQSYVYDLNGNRSARGPSEQSQFISDQIVSSERAIYQSDSNGWGNLTAETSRQSGQKHFFAYRLDGKLTSFSKPEVKDRDDVRAVIYYYDALGRRVAKKFQMQRSQTRGFTQSYVYLGSEDKILLGKAGNGELTLYLDGKGIDEHLGEVSAHSSLGYATDHLGSVLNTHPASWLHAYGAYGESFALAMSMQSIASNPVVYGYTGRQLDPESGKYYYRARMYNPAEGRFLSKDPIGFEGGTTNVFQYVTNSPVNYVDPMGMYGIVAPFPGTMPILIFPGGSGEGTSCISGGRTIAGRLAQLGEVGRLQDELNNEEHELESQLLNPVLTKEKRREIKNQLKINGDRQKKNWERFKSLLNPFSDLPSMPSGPLAFNENNVLVS